MPVIFQTGKPIWIKIHHRNRLLLRQDIKPIVKHVLIPLRPLPGMLRVPQPQPVVMSLLAAREIDPATPCVENAKVVDKLDIAGLNIQLDGAFVGAFFEGAEGMPLRWSEEVGTFKDAIDDLAQDTARLLEEDGGVGCVGLMVSRMSRSALGYYHVCTNVKQRNRDQTGTYFTPGQGKSCTSTRSSSGCHWSILLYTVQALARYCRPPLAALDFTNKARTSANLRSAWNFFMVWSVSRFCA